MSAETPTPESKEPGEAPPRTPLIAMGGILAATLFGALAMTLPFRQAPPEVLEPLQAFADPSSAANIGWIVAIMLGFTLLFLVLIKLERKVSFRLILLGTIGLILHTGLRLVVGDLPAVAVAAGLVALLYGYPEWWVVDVVMLPVAAFAAWLFGISLVLPLVLGLLVALAVYDYLAVYRTGHMISLAEGVMELKVPILFVLPRKPGFSFRGQTKFIGGDEAFYMGLGDAIIPGMLAVTANMPNVNPGLEAAPALGGFATLPALGAALGTLAGFALLSRYVGRGKPHAGLPFLNSGAIAGFFIGAAAVGVRPF
ncbi:MAG: presenilin family intramembrane aspartyl protease PSH [Halobacteria archaeon]